MQVATSDALVRPVYASDADIVYQLYRQTPDYFRIISIPIPTLSEVQHELEAAHDDPRRYTELILAPQDVNLSAIDDPITGRKVVGYLDYKLDYPASGEAMVNLLLILERLQSSGFGRQTILDLEKRLRGQIKRILASIYGQNPRAERFWHSLGYRFAIDAKPILDWYAKDLG